MRDVEPDVASPAPQPSKEISLLQSIRNTWHFANLFQWIFLFGKVVKIDESVDIDVSSPDSPVRLFDPAWSFVPV